MVILTLSLYWNLDLGQSINSYGLQCVKTDIVILFLITLLFIFKNKLSDKNGDFENMNNNIYDKIKVCTVNILK